MADSLPRLVARAVLDDLEDRRGIKRELLAVRYDDPEIYAEIERAVAAAACAPIVPRLQAALQQFERTGATGLAVELLAELERARG